MSNYYIRQRFFATVKVLSDSEVYRLVKDSDAYKALPRKVSGQALRQVGKAWKSYLAAIESYRVSPEKLKAPPRIPRYKDKIKGRNLITYDCQAVSRKALKKGRCEPSGSGLSFPTQATTVKEVRIVPKCGCYVIEVVY